MTYMQSNVCTFIHVRTPLNWLNVFTKIMAVSKNLEFICILFTSREACK